MRDSYVNGYGWDYDDCDDYTNDNDGCAAVLFWTLLVLVVIMLAVKGGCKFAGVLG